jgi:hypothetical protein
MKKALIILFQILIYNVQGQNSPFSIYGGGLNGSTYQQTVIYSDLQNGLLFEAPLDPTNNNNKLPLSFSWRGGGIPSLFITGDSKIGIGTTTPSQKLDVNGNINMAGVSGRRLFMGGAGGSTFGIAYDSNYPNYGIFYTEGEPDYVSISPNGKATAGVMNILGNGKVGIGTSSPTEILEIYNSDTTPGTISLKSSRNDFGYVDVGRISAKQASIEVSRIGMPRAGGTNTGFLTFWTKADNSTDLSEKMRISENGNLGIGTTNPTSKLTVAGNISSREVKVTVNAGADFVFAEDYNLPSLTFLDIYIKENKHLPEIASAKEMQVNGINLSEMNIKLLQKIEEMTLYMIDFKREIDALKDENRVQQEEIKTLKEIKK